MKNKKVLITRQFPEIGSQLLKNEGFDIVQWEHDRPMTYDELLEHSKDKHAIYCTLTDRLDKHLIESCPNLEIISQFAVGYDNIDVQSATTCGIPVGYTPDVLSGATADIAFLLLLATSRKLNFLQNSITKGEWKYFRPNSYLGQELNNKTLGVFGLGRIGVEMAKRCKGAYNMNIIYHNRNRNLKAEEELGAKYVSFDALLAESDVLSVHCALTDDTKDIFNKQAFAKMKTSSIFVNTARGQVHNESDLIDALQAGTIWGAGLDVTNPEPMQADSPLLSMENVTIMPHVGSGTLETRGKMAEMTANNIIEFYKNGKVPHCVNTNELAMLRFNL